MNDKFKMRVYSPTQGTLNEVEKIDFAQNIVLDICGEGFRLDDVILTQCTSLKDKNGKLIYEGDIVKDIGNSKMIMEVKVRKCAFALENKDFVGYFHELGIGFSAKRLEVIGNIYENEELLNEIHN